MREAPHVLRCEIEEALSARNFALSQRSGLTSISGRLARDEHRRSGVEGVTIISTKNTCALLQESSPHYARVVAFVDGLMQRDSIRAGVVLRQQRSGVWANGTALRTGHYYLIAPRTVVYLTHLFTAGQVDVDDEFIGVVALVIVPDTGRVTELSAARMFNLAVSGPQTAKYVQLSALAFMMATLPNVRDRGNYDEITLLRMKPLRP